MKNRKEKPLFDIEDTDDIPDHIKMELRYKGLSLDTIQLIKLFDLKVRISVDELIVALFRKYKKDKGRKWISCACYNLCRKKILKKIEAGVYEKII